MTLAARRASRGGSAWWGADRVSTGNVFTPRIASLHLELDDPPRTLSPAPSTQEWRIRVRKNKNRSTDPLFTADLYESGVLKERVIEGTSVASMAPMILEGSWEADILADPSGKFVEARLTSTNRSGNTYVDIGALEWIPVSVPSVQVSLGIKYNVLKSVAAQPLNLRWNVGVGAAAYGVIGDDIYFDSPNSYVTSSGDDLIFQDGWKVTLTGDDLVVSS